MIHVLMAGVALSAPPPPPPPGPAEPKAVAEVIERLEKRGATKTDLTIELVPAAEVARTDAGLALTVTITNGSPADITAKLAHEWYGGIWPSTDLSASVTPKAAGEAVPFHPVYRMGNRGEGTKTTVIAAGKSVSVDVRMDWSGTGSMPTEPLMDKSSAGNYRVRLLLVFDAPKGRQYAIGPEHAVELPARK